jgi:hypothetical protein
MSVLQPKTSFVARAHRANRAPAAHANDAITQLAMLECA